jgi:hypothetical protein
VGFSVKPVVFTEGEGYRGHHHHRYPLVVVTGRETRRIFVEVEVAAYLVFLLRGFLRLVEWDFLPLEWTHLVSLVKTMGVQGMPPANAEGECWQPLS